MVKNCHKPAGNTLILKCKAGGYPTPNITWYKDDEKKPNRPLGEFRYGTWSMTLEDLVVSDNANYTCVVCNYLGCINFTYHVNVVGEFFFLINSCIHEVDICKDFCVR